MPKKGTLPVPRLLTRRVRVWQRRLGLQNWHITIKILPYLRMHGVHCEANSDWQEDYSHGTFRFCDHCWDGFKNDFSKLDQMVAHELAHFIRARAYDVLTSELRSDGELYKRYERADEPATDELASILVRAYAREENSGAIHRKRTTRRVR